ncbi:hypothetical protein Pyrde_1578 [Pyrodictium delaneyi]|uniref:CBS domain-containing protein n=1 Tax=Pyrodictium delaneyi TaxID=1273541 RepID=A0A0P0N5V2_9CREN|nr:chloride channel protein [Pyrodictium delaneyi]ALL01621.1 hypothetical protein Pyrde_1578 [Pyrodictium delaneyi]OWJ55141.1 hypothetical protein Pdsh_05530 [Pyrodictium delaneyi]
MRPSLKIPEKLARIVVSINERLGYVERWLFISTVTAVVSSLAIGIFYVMLRLVIAVAAYLHGLDVSSILFHISDYSIIALEGHNRLLIPLTVVVGAAIASTIVYRWAPEAEGSGTDAIVNAYHHEAGHVRPRVAVVKAVASALLLGGGGSGGPEGPAVQIGGAAGSFIANVLRLSVEERKIALIAGVAGALSFIFQSPVGAAIFAIEVLYERDMETSALIPALFASVIAYSFSLHILGPGYKLPSIDVGDVLNVYGFDAMASYILLGVFIAPFAYLYVYTFYKVKEGFIELTEKKGIDTRLRPVIGAIIVGIIGVFVPHILGTGEELLAEMLKFFQEQKPGATSTSFISLDVDMITALLLLAILKITATALTVGSGGSGGLLAPGLFAGAMIGELFGLLVAGYTGVEPALYAYLGMAALFGAASKVPIGLAFMVAEVGGTPALIVPALMTSLTASLATRGISIVESQLPQSIPPSLFTAESLLQMIREQNICIRVEKLASKKYVTANWSEPLRVVVRRMVANKQHIVPIVDETGRVVGVLDPGYAGLDLRYALRSSEPVAEVSLSQAPMVRVGECVARALEQMIIYGTDYVIVVDAMYRYHGVITLEDIVGTVFPILLERFGQRLLKEASSGSQGGGEQKHKSIE